MSERTCTEEGCSSRQVARGMCDTHYRRWRKHGSTDAPTAPTVEQRFWGNVDKAGPVSDHRPDLGACWVWTAAIRSDGYGRFSLREADGKRRYPMPHRVSYELTIGVVPDGLQLDHLCRVRHCVNPHHLEPVTGRENIHRGTAPTALNVKKTHCPQGHEYTTENIYRHGSRRLCRPCMKAARERYMQRTPKPPKRREYKRGEANANSRLNDAAVLEIRSLYQQGGISQAKLAERFSVSPSLIGMVVRGEGWTQLLAS